MPKSHRPTRPLAALALLLALAPATARAQAADRAAAPLLRVGDGAVDGTRLAEGTRTLRMVLVQGEQEVVVGTTTEVLRATEFRGDTVIERVQTIESEMLGTFADTVLLRRATLEPIRQRSHNPQRELRLDFEGPRVRGSLIPAEGELVPVRADFGDRLYDANPMDLVIRALPLAPGYAARIPAFLFELGGRIEVMARVTGEERVEGPSGPAEAWVVEIERDRSTGTFWIAKETREVLRQVTAPAQGIELRLVP